MVFPSVSSLHAWLVHCGHQFVSAHFYIFTLKVLSGVWINYCFVAKRREDMPFMSAYVHSYLNLKVSRPIKASFDPDFYDWYGSNEEPTDNSVRFFSPPSLRIALLQEVREYLA
jgi:hypothetical protein